jgi:hypothetical protein
MSNILTRNPLILDSPITSFKSSTASTLGTLTTLVVTKIRWVGTSAAGQVLEFVDPQVELSSRCLPLLGLGRMLKRTSVQARVYGPTSVYPPCRQEKSSCL